MPAIVVPYATFLEVRIRRAQAAAEVKDASRAEVSAGPPDGATLTLERHAPIEHEDCGTRIDPAAVRQTVPLP